MNQDLRASAWIGKRGFTDTQASEIIAQLDRKRLIKIKVLKSALGTTSMKELAHTIATATKSTVDSVTGLVIVLRRGER